MLRRQFDHGHAASAFTELHHLGVPNGTSYGYYRTFRMVVSGVTGSERTLALRLGLVMGIVRLTVNEKFPQLMPSLFLGELATRPEPFDSIDAMWFSLGTLANNKTPDIHGTKLFLLPVVSGGRVSAPSGPPHAAPGRGQGRAKLQTSA